MPRSARRAHVIATPSEFVRGTVIEAFGVRRRARHRRAPWRPRRSSVPDADAIGVVRRRFGLGDRPYLVYPAITHPHKGHLVAGRDAGAPRRRHRARARSVATAARKRRVMQAVHDNRRRRPRGPTRSGRRCRARRADRRCRRRSCSRASTRASARPLVEAMVLGTPIVCSAQPAVREVVGAAAVVVEGKAGEPSRRGLGGGGRPRPLESCRAGRRRPPAPPAVHHRRVGCGPVGGVPPSGRR